MKKEILKMYLRAVGKVLFALVLGALLVFVMKNASDVEPVGIVVCSVLWGIVVLIYLISGLSTIIKGSGQARKYMANSHYNEMQLNEEYENGQKFGRIHVGRIHVFANASDQFYIIPLSDITKMRITHHGENRAKMRPGYYYLRLTANGIEKEIKVYYISREKAEEAMKAIKPVTYIKSEAEG